MDLIVAGNRQNQDYPDLRIFRIELVASGMIWG